MSLNVIKGEIKITSPFGPRNRPAGDASKDHKGIDIDADKGTPIIAYDDGIVVKVGDQGDVGWGKYVILKHKDSDGHVTGYTVYGHMKDEPPVNVGDSVSKGDTIGSVGDHVGTSTGSHLHF